MGIFHRSACLFFSEGKEPTSPFSCVFLPGFCWGVFFAAFGFCSRAAAAATVGYEEGGRKEVPKLRYFWRDVVVPIDCVSD